MYYGAQQCKEPRYGFVRLSYIHRALGWIWYEQQRRKPITYYINIEELTQRVYSGHRKRLAQHWRAALGQDKHAFNE